jgi:Ca2+-binding RTX toxin-like protein
MRSSVTAPAVWSRIGTGRVAAVALTMLLMTTAAAFHSDAEATEAPGLTALEQQFVYELNQARWNPSAVEAEAGLPAGTLLPAPPLAINSSLAASADFKAAEMSEYGYFAHQSPVTEMWPNQLARNYGYPLPNWWYGDANYIESLHAGSPVPADVLQSFVNSPSHRDHVMGQQWFATHYDIGVGMVEDTRVWVIHTGSEEPLVPVFTGVVFSDDNANQRMELGEGLEGVTVSAGEYSTVTNAGGGWTLQVPAGQYTLTVHGGPFVGESSATVGLGNHNVGVDFISGDPVPQIYSYTLCHGRQPTILGTSGDDVIYGTPGPDVIHAGDGNDTVFAGDGNDIVCGGAGDDHLNGGRGRDKLYGNKGSDTLIGNQNSDRLYGGRGSDTLIGQRRNDRLRGNAGDDVLIGGNGTDRLYGGLGVDECTSGERLNSC